jgi:C-terminal processing protease CtpA/Prc
MIKRTVRATTFAFRLAFLWTSIALLGAATPSTAASTQASPPTSTPISAAEQSAVIATLGQQLKAQYVFPDVATATATALSAKAAHGDYRDDHTTAAFAKALSADLRAIGNDKHLAVKFAPDLSPPPSDHQAADGKEPTAEDIAQMIAQMRSASARESYGISRVQRLPGDISYIDLRNFGHPEIVGAAYDAAISLVAGTKALVLDLRQNNGGEPDGVAYLLSHFFAEGDARHLNDIYTRADNSTHQFWTIPSAMPRFTGPIYVLTSHHTGSAAEECAYDLQTQKRATLVGETTVGGANPGDWVPLAHGFMAFIPMARAINPITQTNWEHVGVKPDVAVPAATAMKVAYLAILNDLMKKSKDPGEQTALNNALSDAQSGKIPLPAYDAHD